MLAYTMVDLKCFKILKVNPYAVNTIKALVLRYHGFTK